MKAADRCLSLLLPPFTPIDCAARAELMTTCYSDGQYLY